MTNKIFISYPRELQKSALAWQYDLEAEELESFVCHKDAPEIYSIDRKDQREVLQNKIDDAPAVLVLWDGNYGRSPWCAWEFQFAVQRGKRILVVNFGDTPLPPQLVERIEVVDRASLVKDRLRVPPVTKKIEPLALDRVPFYPAASLLESRFPPRFDAKTRGARELATMLGWLVLSVGVQLAVYFAAAPLMTTGHATHLWALVAATSIAVTMIGSVTLSNKAAAATGVTGLALALAVLGLRIRWGSDLDHGSIVLGAAAMSIFDVSLLLLFRDRLLGVRLDQVPVLDLQPKSGRGRGHVLAAAGIMVVGTLLVIGLESLDAVIEADARPQSTLEIELAARGVPVQLGIRVGFLVGIVLAVAVYRRVLRNYRGTAPRRVLTGCLWAFAACAVATAIGYCTGWWIESNIVEAISSWGGSYAGSQIGVLITAGLTIPIAMGLRLSVLQERWWGMAGALTVIAIITWKVHSFPFAANRDGVETQIVLGALAGVLPVALVRVLSHALSTIRRDIMLAVLAMHVALVWIAIHSTQARLPGHVGEKPPEGHPVRLGEPRPKNPVAPPKIDTPPKQPPVVPPAPPKPPEPSVRRLRHPVKQPDTQMQPGDADGDNDGSAAPSPPPPVPFTVTCPAPATMDGNTRTMNRNHTLTCNLGGLHTVTAIYISVGCNDGEHGYYTLTFGGGSSSPVKIDGFCNSRTVLRREKASSVTIHMDSGGGPDNHISFVGWSIAAE